MRVLTTLLLYYNPRFNDTTVYVAAIAIIALIIMTFRQRGKRLHYGFKVLPMGLELLKILGLALVIAIVASIMVFNAGIPYCVLLLAVLTIIINFIATKPPSGVICMRLAGTSKPQNCPASTQPSISCGCSPSLAV
ncbi:MAG: hypothetical protein EOL87_17790 [Spartobacteria bacterium]|nr:hypothetical protein [Spartobacteria bacterium]